MKFNNQEDIDLYLDNILNQDKQSLQELFDQKISELNIAKTSAFKIMDVQPLTMKGILEGSQKQVDVLNLVKLSNFLQIPLEQIIALFVESVEKTFPILKNVTANEVNFIKENFDLAALKKAGLIDSLSDFDHIKKRIMGRLGLKSIFEYKRPTIDIAFSAGTFKPETNLTRAFWISSALSNLGEINNPNTFDRDALLKLFPSISWYSTKIEDGLLEVSKLLFKIGITVIYQQPLQSLKIRGATFSHSGKPAIILSNYTGFYATLWFALIHELYHVLFDWNEIKANRYHITDDTNEQLSVQEREREADNFAREFLFSKDKMNFIKRYLNDFEYVKNYAITNHIDPSIIYVFNAFDTQSTNRSAWARAKKYSPSIEKCKKPLNWHWNDSREIDEAIPSLISYIK